ncbi:MAG: hypothetical protein KAX11_10360 [Candidatus Aminicenantes bacterium]|nr:hypothetical protein [Candidatus Aminicenantes bacterium]
MRPRATRTLLLGCVILFLQSAAFPLTFGLKGLITGWMTVNTDSITEPFFGLRYIPEFSIQKSLSEGRSLDFELSLNAFGTAYIHSLTNTKTDGKIDLYRMWGRYSSSRFEVRLGLQKINFGSASLLRPLMWFDRIDPRDPLHLTDGVYGMLMRYYFLNNANVWIWGLYGNDEPKGWEFLPSKSKSAEFGGRVQLPMGNGEWAFTYHHRTIDSTQGLFAFAAPNETSIPENRFALDGKWDLGVGLWFEGTLTHQCSEILPFNWQRAINIGIDYTFGLGNGLNVIGEHFMFTSSHEAFGSGEGITFSALSMSYPLSLLDNLSCIVYYDWKKNDLYSFINWRRTYDQWMINIIGFWNPEQFQIYQNLPENTLYAGRGFQIMIVFNY